jgi:predicted O-methyltransferase YrrM
MMPDPPTGEALRGRLDPDAPRAMRTLIAGAIDTQALYVIARLGVADALALGPRTADDLAGRTGADAATLRRVLRYLTRRGVFAELDEGRFALTVVGELLQTAHPLSLRQSAIRAGEDMWRLAGCLSGAVQSGTTPHEDVFGASYFDRLESSGTAEAFGARMRIGAAELAASLATLECVRRAVTVVDVGGGQGHVLAHLLAAQPHLRGVLFDRPHVVQGARRILEDAGVADRCRVAGGDLFEGLPGGGDLYLLSWVLHDWNDGRAEAILRSCRAASPGARVLVIEVLMPDRPATATVGAAIDPFLLDMQMLLLTGGRERTVIEYSQLLARAGYAIDEVRPEVSALRGAAAITASAVARYE